MLKRTVWKFEIPMEAEGLGVHWEARFTIKMPVGAEILTVQVQGSKPVLWAKVDPECNVQDQAFILVGTGHPMPIQETDLVEYVDTFQLADGGLVFHLFKCDECPF